MNPFRHRVPEVFQIEAAECGAASLCMILGYYGRYIDLTEMRRDCHISRDGSRMSYLMEAAKKHGMTTEAFRCGPELKDRKLPAIAFWNYSHFLVVEEVSDRWVYLVDPAYGRRRLTKEEFAKGYSGVVLELQCTDAFEPCGRPYSPLPAIIRLLREHTQTLLYLTVLTVMINLVAIALPWFTTMFVDYYLPYMSNAQMDDYFLAFTGVLVVQTILLLIRRHVNLRFRRIQSASLTGRITQKLLHLPVSYFGTRSHATIDAHLNDISSFTDFVSARLLPILLDLVFSFVYAGLLFVYSYKVAIPTLLLIIFLVALLTLLLGMSRTAVVRSSNTVNAFYGEMVQNVRLFETIKSVAMEDKAFQGVMQKFSAWQNALQSSKKILSVIQAIPIAVPLLIQIFVIAVGSAEVIAGRMSLGEVLACQSISMFIFAPVVTTIAEFSSLQGQQIKIKAMEDILREEDDPSFLRTEETPAGGACGEVEMREVSFGYNDALPPVVENISFRVPAGRSIAFVGSSGSGKSSVLKLVEGLYQPRKGEILFGGIDQRRIGREKLAGEMAVVSQTPFLFTGTVRENITLFDRSIDINTVAEAAKAACVFDAIEAHPGGFNAMMSPTENSFSGGEVQRIMIARALVRKPSILILDEATSALDTIVEEQVMRNIREMNITLLVVAHRLSAVRDCDEILVLQKGKIVEQGCHAELAALGGVYTELMSSEESQ